MPRPMSLPPRVPRRLPRLGRPARGWTATIPPVAAQEGNGVPQNVSVSTPPSARATPLRYVIATPEAIYGTILVSGVLAGTQPGVPLTDVFFSGILASTAIWTAHVVAVTIATHGVRGNTFSGVRASISLALTHSSGILVGPIVPIALLALGVVGVLPETASFASASVSGLVILAVLGWLALAERGAKWYARLSGALLTALAGLVAAILKGLI